LSTILLTVAMGQVPVDWLCRGLYDAYASGANLPKRESYFNVRRYARIWLLAAGLLVVLLIGAAVWVYWAARKVPPWYEQSVAASERSAQEKASDEMEQRIAEFVSAFESTGRWKVVITEEQVNGWLAHGLPKKHADALPEGFSQPRVKIESDGVSGACRVERGLISGIVSLKVDLYMAEPGVVAARIRRARLGQLPWPLDKVLENVSQSARAAEIPLAWHQAEADPVAVVRIPLIEGDKQVRIETLQLADGKVTIAGETRRVKP
jgi:hypothetical protein